MNRKFNANKYIYFDPIERFWDKVDKKSDGECWEWKGSTHQNGYGAFGVSGKHFKAHRYSWTIHFGEIPEGILVCHHCDNRKCVNPKHLFLGTQKDNIADRDRKGRRNKALGERHGNHRWTVEIITKIKQDYKSGKSQREIARTYGVDFRQVNSIVKGRVWGWLDV